MALYAIGDLHFSPQNSKPMDIFGWEDHKQKIFEYWKRNIREQDVIIIAGDTSWAMKFDEAKENLDEIDQMPGKKIILKGNHDYWWQSHSKMQKEYPEMFFLQNNCYQDDNYAIFGTRGWDLPGGKDFKEADQKIFDREKARLIRSLEGCKKDNQERIKIVAMHYPPVIENSKESEITEIIREHQIQHMVYGHLHGPESFKNVFEGEKDGTRYHLVSSDYLDFIPKKIIE